MALGAGSSSGCLGLDVILGDVVTSVAKYNPSENKMCTLFLVALWGQTAKAALWSRCN